jgi:hypothetical protein
MLWSAGSAEDFARAEKVLARLCPHSTTTKHEGFDTLEGRDPDDVPILISYPGPDPIPRGEIISRIYDR